MNRLPIILTSCLLPISAFAQKGDREKHRDDEDRSRRLEAFFSAFDTDKDGQVTLGEFRTGERISKLEPLVSEKLFKRLDKNSDGFLSVKELKLMTPKRGKRSLRAADLNNDRRISREEFDQHEPFVNFPEEKREEMFTRLDKNSDGFLDHKEGRKGRKGDKRGDKRPIFEHLDLNSDGKIDLEEFQKSPRIDRMTEEEQLKFFQRADRNGDGGISVEEFRPPKFGDRHGPKK